MRLTQDSITKLQAVMKRHFNLEYDNEKAQVTGRAVLRLVGLKLHQQLNKEHEDEARNPDHQSPSS